MKPSYDDWNKHIWGAFFNEELAGKRVVFYVDSDRVRLWAEELGLAGLTNEQAVSVFIDAVLVFLNGDSASIAKTAGVMAGQWKNNSYAGVPRFAALIAALVLASSGTGDTANLRSYYRCYRKIMTGADAGSGGIPHMGELQKVWMAVRDWSFERNPPGVGFFEITSVSKAWVHVGVIIAQTILLPKDITALADVFYAENADSNFDYSEQVIESWLLRHGARLSSRLKRALKGESREIVFIRVRDELSEWDGSPASLGAAATSPKKRTAWLAIGPNDQDVPVVRFRLDFDGRGGASELLTSCAKSPDGGCLLKASSIGTLLSAHLAFVDELPQDAAGIANSEEVEASVPLQISDETAFRQLVSHGFRSYTQESDAVAYSVRATHLKVFVSGGEYLGEDEYTEVDGLIPGFEHIVIVNEFFEDVAEVKSWAADNSVPAHKSHVSRYVPEFFLKDPMWTCFHIRRAAQQHHRLQALQYRRYRFARLEGGVRVFGTGNRFLEEVPPTLRVDYHGSFSVRVNDTVIASYASPSSINISKSLVAGTNVISVEAEDGGQANISLSLVRAVEWQREGPGVHKIGERLKVQLDGHDCIGTFVGAFSKGYKADVKPCWVVVGGELMPCASPSVIMRRIKAMESMAKTPISYSGEIQLANWRAVKRLKLARTFSDTQSVELLERFKKHVI